jgi:hypothetical protein
MHFLRWIHLRALEYGSIDIELIADLEGVRHCAVRFRSVVDNRMPSAHVQRSGFLCPL